jgi:hypothetical protein
MQNGSCIPTLWSSTTTYFFGMRTWELRTSMLPGKYPREKKNKILYE